MAMRAMLTNGDFHLTFIYDSPAREGIVAVFWQ